MTKGRQRKQARRRKTSNRRSAVRCSSISGKSFATRCEWFNSRVCSRAYLIIMTFADVPPQRNIVVVKAMSSPFRIQISVFLSLATVRVPRRHSAAAASDGVEAAAAFGPGAGLGAAPVTLAE
jgi:hypothetical protein